MDEDGRARTIRFTLRDGGSEGEKKGGNKAGGKGKGGGGRSLRGSTSFMSRFEGGWRVAPLSQSALDAALRVSLLLFFAFVSLENRRERDREKREEEKARKEEEGKNSPPSLFDFPEQRRQQVKKNPFEAAATSLRDAAEASPLLRALQRRRGAGGAGGKEANEAASSSSATSSLVSLDHALAPSFAPPPPFDRVLFAAIAGKQVRVLIEDLRKEAERRRTGGGTEKVSGNGKEAPKNGWPPFPPLLW